MRQQQQQCQAVRRTPRLQCQVKEATLQPEGRAAVVPATNVGAALELAVFAATATTTLLLLPR